MDYGFHFILTFTKGGDSMENLLKLCQSHPNRAFICRVGASCIISCQSEFNLPHERGSIMKKALILVFSLFLLSSLNCATTEQELSKTEEPTKEAEKAKETVTGGYDLTGTWIMTEKQTGCDRNETVINTIEITQEGNTIKYTNLDTKNTFLGKTYNDTVIMDKISWTVSSSPGPATIRILDFTIKMGKDTNTLTGGSKWEWVSTKGATCIGVDKAVWKRKLQE